MRPASLRPGVALLEAVVVLLIAAATCLLLLPALNRSRENARANYCRNNLRRLDQAMQQYRESVTPDAMPPLADWPETLIGFLDNDWASKEPNARAHAPRPMSLTCPSHPLAVPSKDAPQPCLYELIVVEGDSGGWAFRDQPRDLNLEPYAEGSSAWLDVPEQSPASQPIPRTVAQQWKTQLGGPHAGGAFQCSEGQGKIFQ